ncbi:phosphoglycolate phosphatase [Rosenbergiella australiborealis]|uniref:Phosphoglycolate phosphatase n=1 Tax=Rosenbergiella australiborealis TaxID=1544696 RepID=A0ABS5T4M4_9GAMM|nr:phosphoglycolate phosphatase [Rosenbergiella australiborealis]MBT0727314.1 phosphoglycolate phosphatase [Rosenbergiella australiborealis]
MAPFTDIRGIAFDLDGTLVDSAPGLSRAIDLMLEDLQLPVAGLENVTRWIGNGADIMVNRALTWALGTSPDESQVAQARSCFDHHYLHTAESGSQLFSHVLEVLEVLSSKEIPLAIVTNKPTPFVRPLLESLNIDHFFSLIIGGDDVPIKKPHPAAIFMVLGQFGLLTEQLLFVGDSRNDIQAAKSAGVRSVGLSYGYNYGEPIEDSHPDQVIHQFDHLLSLIGK